MSRISAVVPQQGTIGIVGIDPTDRKRGFAPVWLRRPSELTEDYIVGAVADLTRRGATDHYFTIAGFEWSQGVKPRRFAPDARFFRSYAADLDCHGQPGQYASTEEAVQHVWNMLVPVGLLPTRVVHTGRGVQLFWSFNRDLTTTEWLKLSDSMWSILMHFGIKADPAVHRDRARVLRLPSTANSRGSNYSHIMLDTPQLEYAPFVRQVQALMDARAIPLVAPEIKINARSADQDGDVYLCPQNEARLRWLLDRVPSDFADKTGDPLRSYGNYRNAVWAIKRTGLPNAWDAAVEWAERASKKYDSWLEGLEHTWDSDNEDRTDGVNAGTLVYLARTYGKKKDLPALGAFHFLDRQEIQYFQETSVSPNAQCFADGLTEAEWLADDGPDPITTFYEDVDIDLDEARENPLLFPFLHLTDYRPDPTEFPDVMETPWDQYLDSLPADIAHELRTADIEPYDPDCPDEPPFEGDAGGAVSGISLHTVPPIPPMRKTFGAPTGPLPAPLQWAMDGWGVGWLANMKGADKDDKDLKQFELISTVPVELVDAAIAKDDNGGDQYVYLFRKWDHRTKLPCAMFPVNGSELTDPTALGKKLGDNGILLSDVPQVNQKMGRVLKYLVDKRLADRAPIEIITQAGWLKEDTAFALGHEVLTQSGQPLDCRIAKGVQDALRGFGEVKGSVENQRKLLGMYAPKGFEHSRAIISMMLGSILSKFVENSGGIVYTHESETGRGKSLTHKIGLSLFGNPVGMLTGGRSSPSALEFILCARNDIMVYMDDLAVGSRIGDKRNEALKEFFLQVTQGQEGSKLSRSGDHMVRGDKTWNAPLFLTTNSPIEYIIPDRGPAVVAAFARILTIPFRSPEFAGGPFIEGKMIDGVLKENYGHIGREFLRWCVQHAPEVKARCEAVYAGLQRDAYQNGKGNHHRFHNATIATGIVALEWLVATNNVPGWNLAETTQALKNLAYNYDEHVASLGAIDMTSVLTAFLSQYQTGMAVFTTPTAMPSVVPELHHAKNGIVIRVEGDQAWLSLGLLRGICTQQGIEFSAFMEWLRATYGEAVVESTNRDMADRISNFPRMLQRVVRVPSKAVIEMPQALPEGSNVVPMPFPMKA